MKRSIAISLIIAVSLFYYNCQAQTIQDYGIKAAAEFKTKYVREKFLDPKSYQFIKIQAAKTISRADILETKYSKLINQMNTLNDDINQMKEIAASQIIEKKKYEAAVAKNDGPVPSIAWVDTDTELNDLNHKLDLLSKDMLANRRQIAGMTESQKQSPGLILFQLTCYGNNRFAKKEINAFAIAYLVGEGIIPNGIERVKL